MKGLRERRTPVAFRTTHGVNLMAGSARSWFIFMKPTFAAAMEEKFSVCLTEAVMSSCPMLLNSNRETFGVVAEKSGNVICVAPREC